MRGDKVISPGATPTVSRSMSFAAGGHLHASSCRLISNSLRPVPRCTGSLTGPSPGSRLPWQAPKQSRQCRCNAKKSKKKRRAEAFDERPEEPAPEAFPDEELDTSIAEQAGDADTSGEVYEETAEQEAPQYQQTQAVAPPQPAPRSGPSDTVKLGGLALGAVALIAAIAFAVRKFANRKLPEVEKVLSCSTFVCHDVWFCM